MDSFDQQFIDMMVPHHESGIEMARVALTGTSRPELKSMAESIVKAQQTEVAQLKTWRKAWFGSDQTPPLERMPMLPGMSHGKKSMKDKDMKGMGTGKDMKTMDMRKDIDKLRSAAGALDREFIDMMRQHHRSAIEAGRLAQTQGQKSEIRELGGRIVSDQQREIDKLTEWRRAWFGST